MIYTLTTPMLCVVSSSTLIKHLLCNKIANCTYENKIYRSTNKQPKKSQIYKLKQKKKYEKQDISNKASKLRVFLPENEESIETLIIYCLRIWYSGFYIFPKPILYPNRNSHTCPNRCEAGQVTRITCKIAIPTVSSHAYL